MILPNLILAGSPKCGTTSFYNWLSIHPNVCSAKVKEVRFFMDEGYPVKIPKNHFKNTGIRGYSDYFEYKNEAIIFEATPDYMYQQIALEQIPMLDSQPKIIFLLRKPSDRLLSLYKFAKNNSAVLDKKITFSEFINMCFQKKGNIQKNLILKSAIEHTKYINYLSRWQKIIRSDQIHIYLFEDMKRNPLVFMKNVCKDLQIDSTVYEKYHFSTANKSVHIKSQKLHKIKKKIMDYYPEKGFIFDKIRNAVRTMYYKLNSSRRRDFLAEKDIKIQKYLDSYFSDYNKSLSEKYTLDLSLWN